MASFSHNDVVLPMLADLRYSARGLKRSPGLSVALFLTIALGIGGNAMVYGFIRGSLQRPTVAGEPDRLVSVLTRDSQGSFLPLSADQVRDLSMQATIFEAVGALREDHGEIEFKEQKVSAVIGATTSGFFAALKIRRAEPQVGDVWLSHRLWLEVFGAPALAPGQQVKVDGRPYRIAGVAPDSLDGLYGGRSIDVWMPIDTAVLDESERTGRSFWTIARLRQGVSPSQADAAVSTLLRTEHRGIALPYTGVEPQVAGGLSRISAALPAAAVIVFLIACANLATFLLSRAVSRSHETSVRVAIGATRDRIRRQLLMDALLVSVAGAAAGAIIALWASRLVPAMFFSQDAEKLSFAPGIVAVGVAAVVSIAITVLCGLLPLTEVRDDDPASVLRRETGGLSNRARRARVVLVVAQMSACCFLLISAGLLLAGFRMALKTSLGNRLGDPVIATLTWSAGFVRETGGDDFYRLVQRTVQQTPGVTSAEWTSALPGGQPAWQPISVEPPPTGMADFSWRAEVFPPGPAVNFVVTKKAGRLFGGSDRIGSCPAVLLNETAAALAGGDPVGRLIEDPAGRAIEIVGVVSVQPKDARGSGESRSPEPPTVYYYGQQAPPPVRPGSIAGFRLPTMPAADRRASLDSTIVAPAYFNAVGAVLSSGESLPGNLSPGGCRIAVVNTQAEERYFGGAAAGRSILTPSRERVLVVGVVKTLPLRVSQAAIEPAIFYPMVQSFTPRMTLLIGTSAAASRVVEDVRQRVLAIPSVREQRDRPRIVTLDEHLSMTSLATERITTTLFGVCALLAVVLSAMGVYGAMSDAVHQRRRELALRAALGAQGWRLMRQVLGEGARLSALGAVVGALAAAALQRWGLAAVPGAAVWVAWIAAPVMLAVVVVAASWLPARRAATADPLMLMKDV